MVGILLIGFVASSRFESYLGSRAALEAFHSAPSTAEDDGASRTKEPATSSEKPPSRPSHPFRSKGGLPIAVLEIPSIELTVPVFNGTDSSTLNHGVGRIPGTAHPGEVGNLAIAGHRDTYFRGLKHLKPGDPIDLRMLASRETYIVNRIQIVSPQEVSVLRATESPTVTLITCYPFNFIGRAPKRFVVTAELLQNSAAGSTAINTRPILPPFHQPKEKSWNTQ